MNWICNIGRWLIPTILVFGLAIAPQANAGFGINTQAATSATNYNTRLCSLIKGGHCPTEAVADEWMAAGATAEQAAGWETYITLQRDCNPDDYGCPYRISPEDAIKWFKYGYTLNEAIELSNRLHAFNQGNPVNSGHDNYPDIANEWKMAGFSVVSMDIYMEQGKSLNKALQERAASNSYTKSGNENGAAETVSPQATNSGVGAASQIDTGSGANSQLKPCASLRDEEMSMRGINPCIPRSAMSGWQAAGVPPQQAAEWEQYVDQPQCDNDIDGCQEPLTKEDAIKWFKYGFTPTEAQQITAAILANGSDYTGICMPLLNADTCVSMPDRANQWKRAGFTTKELLVWIKRGKTIDGALEGVKTEHREQAAWAQSDIPASDKPAWIKAGFSPDVASKWMSAGISTADAKNYRNHGIKVGNALTLSKALKGRCAQGVRSTDPASLNPYAALGKCYFVKAEVTQILSSTEALAQTTDDIGFGSGKFIVLDYVDKPTPGEGDTAYGVFLVKAAKQYQAVSGGMQTVAVATLVYDIRQ